MTRHKRVRLAITSLAACTLAACEMVTRPPERPEPPEPPGPEATTIEIQATVTELLVGSTVQLSSVVLDQVGKPLPGAVVQWSSTSPLVASVSATGLVEALADGSSLIVASLGKAADTIQVTVRPLCSAVVPQGALPLSSFSGVSVGGSICFRAGEARSVRGYTLVVPTDHQVQMALNPVAFGDSVLITNAAGTDTLQSFGTRIAGSVGSYYLLLNFTTTLSPGTYVVWVLRGGVPTAGAALSGTANALCLGAAINRSLAVNDTVATAHTGASCLFDGTYAEGWEFTTVDSSALSFSLLLGAWNIPHLVIADSAMTTSMRVNAFADHLMLDVVVPPGKWRLWVTGQPPTPMYPSGTLSPPSGYAFTLTRNPAPLVCGAATTPLVVGVPVAGSLNSADCVQDGSSPRARIDQFTFTVATETTYDFALSAGFLPVHFLRASNDSIVMIDGSIGGPSLTTRKTLVPDTYTYVVRPAFNGTGGSYTVTVTQP